MHLHWHRRDLRLSDNPALTAGSGPIIPVFVFDREVLKHAGSPRRAFLLDALHSLRRDYRELESDLLILDDDPSTRLPELVEAYDIGSVSWGADYSGLARDRDLAVRESLEENGMDPTVVHEAVFHPPGSITTNRGDPYSVFSYYSKKWHDREKESSVDPPAVADLAETTQDVFGEGMELPTVQACDCAEAAEIIPDAGTDSARGRLREFCAEPIFRYETDREYPAREGTSRLSAHLTFGTIGIRSVFEATERARSRAENRDEHDSVSEFQDQLAWREFYAQVLWDRPETVTENFKSFQRAIDWETNETHLAAWKRGETGYPIVDAGMRQLRDEAYMHNRVRMIVASFLTKDLLLDWRKGYDWFRERLVDHDTANDVGGWQWAASTGTDAQPYFRIFNPMTQGERYDPDAAYIHEYVPELQDVPPKVIHSWHTIDRETRDEHAPSYVAPVVDHATRREEAIAMFERARGEE